MTQETTPSADVLQEKLAYFKSLLNRWLGEEDWLQPLDESDSDGDPTLAEPDLSGHELLVEETMEALMHDAWDQELEDSPSDLEPEAMELPAASMPIQDPWF
jgi:hypothetical protein